MKKRPLKSILSERMHKSFVIVCLGVTLYGVAHLGMRWYNYFTVLRPETKARELRETETLLMEGSAKNSQL